MSNLSVRQEPYKLSEADLGTPPLILVVDDDKSMRILLRKAMEKEGYQVVEASDGEECLAIYHQRYPEIILLDAMMPVMDGFTCCAELQILFGNDTESPRDRPSTDLSIHPPILMVTGLEDQASVDRAFEVGATDYITKPIHWAVLRQRVRRLLEASRAVRDSVESKRVAAEIQKALESEKELSELKSRFVTMASHEFRTPLTTILSSAELLHHYSHKWGEEKKLTHLERIQVAVKHMTQMLEDVLLIGKAEAGKLELQPTSLDLIHFCHELVEEMQISATHPMDESHTHTVVFASQGQCADALMDVKLLRHILSNLLSNALKYSPQGSTVHFSLVCDQGAATFLVRDEGIGIPAPAQAKLFDPFYRASNVGTISGTGLGLAIVKKSVDLHGGKITVDSEVGAGTTFTVTIPLSNQLSINHKDSDDCREISVVSTASAQTDPPLILARDDKFMSSEG